MRLIHLLTLERRNEEGEDQGDEGEGLSEFAATEKTTLLLLLRLQVRTVEQLLHI